MLKPPAIAPGVLLSVSIEYTINYTYSRHKAYHK